jgi:hypothetical protein
MDVRGLLRPVGPLPARVYWVRRLVPLALVVVLVAVIAISCSGGSSSRSDKARVATTPTPTPSASGTHSASPTPRASSTATAAVTGCHARDLAVTASTDAPSYGAGRTPLLKVAVRNAGSQACLLVQSPSRRNWTIRSGNDLIWSTVGCPKSTAAIQTRLDPNQSVVHTMAWNRHRIGPHCTASRVAAQPGTYQLSVIFDGVRSSVGVFQLT